MGIGFNAYLKKFIFSSRAFGFANFKADKSYISHLWNLIALTGNSALLREHDNISPDYSLYSFPIKLGQNFQKLYW